MLWSPTEKTEGKEATLMKYEKPEVVAIGPASESIQNNSKGSGVLEMSYPYEKSAGAYQADE
jgi:hypothetical protein